MTPAEALLWKALQRRAAALAPDLGRELLTAFDNLRVRLPADELARLIREGSTDRLIAELLDDPAFAAAFRGFQQRLQNGIADAAEGVAKGIPGIEFDVLNPRIIQGIAELQSKVMTNLKDQIREGVRSVVSAGLEASKPPLEIAQELRAILGLAPNQEQAVRNFRMMLEQGDQEVLSRALRDKRYDATLERLLGKDNGLVMYHGTAADFASFQVQSSAAHPHENRDLGIYFTRDPAQAQSYAGEAGRVIRSRLALTNPYTVDSWGALQDEFRSQGATTAAQIREALIAKGYDGVIFRNPLDTKFAKTDRAWAVVFDSKKIKDIPEGGGPGLSPEQIDMMVAAYRRKFLAFNAETNARTAALDAQKLGQRLTYDQAVADKLIDGSKLMKRWATVRDSRVRPSHRIMEGETVPYDERFSNGQMIPGETDYNCRCLAIYSQVRDPLAARKPGVGPPPSSDEEAA